MSGAIPAEAAALADQLQAQGLPELFGAKEVLVWELEGNLAFGLRGDPLRIERSALMDPMMANEGHSLDVSLQRMFGLDASVYRQGRYGVGVEGGIGQRLDSGTASIAQVFDDLLREAAEEVLERPVAVFSLLPSQGAPALGSRGLLYHNGRTGKTVQATDPPWVVEVEVASDVEGWGGAPVMTTHLGADFCQVVDLVSGCDSGTSFMRFPGRDLDVLVTHSVAPFQTPSPRDAAAVGDYWAHCGGILFASVAVGEIPAARFGTVNLILDPALVLGSLRPYAKKGRWPVVTYTSDAWTETSPQFLSDLSILLYRQLTGQWTPSVYGFPHMYVLGPILADQLAGTYQAASFRGGAPQLVRTTKKLGAGLQRRARLWPPHLTEEEVAARQEEGSDVRYPYFETKVNGILGVDCVRAVAFPSHLGRSVRALLRRARFPSSVKLLPIRIPKEDAQALEWGGEQLGPLYAYSWAVRDAVLRSGHPFEVRE